MNRKSELNLKGLILLKNSTTDKKFSCLFCKEPCNEFSQLFIKELVDNATGKVIEQEICFVCADCRDKEKI